MTGVETRARGALAVAARPCNAEALDSPKRVVLDMDSTEIPVYGQQEQSAYRGKQALKMTRLFRHRFRSHEVHLWLSVIAYNLGNLWRRPVLLRRIEKWSLTCLPQ